jgi:hypothetical protein
VPLAFADVWSEQKEQGGQDERSGSVSRRAGVLISLAGIVILALILRLWGIGFGLPYAYHVDEPAYVSAALNLGAGIIGRQPNPTGFSNILFGEYAGYFVLGRLGGRFNSTAAFEQAYRADPSIFLLLARLTSAVLGLFTVLVVYWLGRELWGELAGLLASLFLALAFLHVRDSHYAVPDVAATCFVTLSVLLCVHALRHGRLRSLLGAALVAGLAIATKWTAFPIAIPLAIALLSLGFRRSEHSSRGLGFNPRALAATIPLLGGFLAGGFQLLVQPATFIEYALREARAGEAGGFGAWQIDTVPGWVFYLKTLNYGLGTVLLVLGLIGGLGYLIHTLRQRDKTGVLILAFPLTYGLLMGTTRHYFARYALPLIPFILLLAAAASAAVLRGAANALSAWIRTSKRGLRWGLLALGTLAAVGQPLAYSIQHDILLTQQDSRTLAKHWIEANIPQGSKIAMDWRTHGPPLSSPDSEVPGSERVYDVTLVGGTGLADHSLEWYQEQGFDYLIASSFIYDIHLVDTGRNAERRAFYASLDQELQVVQVFGPSSGDHDPPFIFDEIYGPAVSLWERERPGPVLKIYRVEP